VVASAASRARGAKGGNGCARAVSEARAHCPTRPG
jgi:hypothetical protein